MQLENWRIRCVTWNLAGRAAEAEHEQDLQLLLPPEALADCHFVAVGFQEVSASAGSLWTRMTKECPWPLLLRRYLGPKGFVHLSCLYRSRPRLLGSVLCIFIRRDRLVRLRCVTAGTQGTGLSGYSPHKGTVACHIRFKDRTNLTLLDSHFAPHQHQLAYRIKEYRLVLNTIRFAGGSQAVISDDYVIWMGDFNFRVDYYSIPEAIKLAQSPQFGDLEEYDQLHRVRRQDEAFQEFQEAAISFPPTYRFVLGKTVYDDKRSPSWCDRVLSRCSEVVGVPKRRPADTLSLRQLSYASHPNALASDHKPVSADFQFQVSMVEEDDNWDIEFDETDWLEGQENMCSFVIKDASYTLSSFDWIGVYRTEMSSDVDDAVTWSYALTAWEDRGTMRIIFKKQYAPPLGTYRLGYYSRERQCLIGLSPPFKVISSQIDKAEVPNSE